MAESLLKSSKQRQTWRQSMDIIPNLMSSTGSRTEQLYCSVCQNVFTDPVTTPCGHNFCKTCLKQCWDISQDFSCPFCKKTFSKRPDLKINTTLRQLVLLFKEKLSLRKSEVFCDICDEGQIKALKSCLVCQTSYCETHLEPHQRVQNLKKHKLINPVENIKDYICQKHERPLELFCRDDQTRVCVFCTEGDHKNHNTVPLEHETEERKTQLIKTQTDVQQMIQNRNKKIQDIKHSAELRNTNTKKEKADHVELFTALIRSIERCQAELLEMMEQKQKAAEKQDEDLIKELEQENIELQWRDIELEQISHTEDDLYLLKIYPSMCSPPQTKNWTEISINTHLSVETQTALTQLQETIDEKLSEAVLRRMQQYSVDVTLDPDTAHPKLVLSDDRKQVRHGEVKHKLPNNPERFDICPCVMGKEGFSSGRFYFEVQVKGKTEWDLGVTRESINRKGEITACPQNGYWTMCLRNGNDYSACAGPSVSLSLRVKPQKVGVFVDYEEGLVSFYDVESRSHICSFTGQSFTGKLYPFFSPALNNKGTNASPLIISLVNYNK